jgi:hypothetical protein
MGGFQYPATAPVRLGLGVWPIGDENSTPKAPGQEPCTRTRSLTLRRVSYSAGALATD